MVFRRIENLLGRSLANGLFAAVLICLCTGAAEAASIRGIVSDASGARVTGATVNLFSGGQVVGTTVSGADGSFQIITGIRGRFFLVVTATKFKQMETPG